MDTLNITIIIIFNQRNENAKKKSEVRDSRDIIYCVHFRNGCYQFLNTTKLTGYISYF